MDMDKYYCACGTEQAEITVKEIFDGKTCPTCDATIKTGITPGVFITQLAIKINEIKEIQQTVKELEEELKRVTRVINL